MHKMLMSMPLVLSLSACAITGASTEESLLFSSSADTSHEDIEVLNPYKDLHVSVEFICPEQVQSVMLSPFIPLPPVIPAGLVNDRITYLRIQIPIRAKSVFPEIKLAKQDGSNVRLPYWPAQKPELNVVDHNGQSLRLPEGKPSKYVVDNGEYSLVTYTMNTTCRSLDEGTIEFPSFSIDDVNFQAIKARLKFKSKIKFSGGYWQA